MTRTKAKGRKHQRHDSPARVAIAAKKVSKPTPSELLLQSAQLIASSEYEQAKAVCAVAYDGALNLNDEKLCMDALEILGTIELELGELDQAREVSLNSSQGSHSGLRTGPQKSYVSLLNGL